jgi:hypothetical protein
MKQLFAMMIQFMTWKVLRDMWRTINFGSGTQGLKRGHALSAQVRVTPQTTCEIVAWLHFLEISLLLYLCITSFI